MLTSLRARFAALWAPVRARLVDDWRRAAKAWSTWVAAIGAAIYGGITQFPMVAAGALSSLPFDLREILPQSNVLALILFGLIFGLKFLKQGKQHG
ncbi:MAG TPA: hypothetical protein VF503_01405 [Sphingobium sp.]|uniref:DUF7940 domain-containing protein n=1 Tax=Sphingobium sp. TaxID=1912891 RepID=UPI002ED29070